MGRTPGSRNIKLPRLTATIPAPAAVALLAAPDEPAPFSALSPEVLESPAALARLALVQGELFALATQMPRLDAQVRRGALLGVPRLTLLRANALVRFVRTGDPVPGYPGAIPAIAPF